MSMPHVHASWAMFIDVHVEALIMRAFVARRQLELLLFLYLLLFLPHSPLSIFSFLFSLLLILSQLHARCRLIISTRQQSWALIWDHCYCSCCCNMLQVAIQVMLPCNKGCGKRKQDRGTSVDEKKKVSSAWNVLNTKINKALSCHSAMFAGIFQLLPDPTDLAWSRKSLANY